MDELNNIPQLSLGTEEKQPESVNLQTNITPQTAPNVDMAKKLEDSLSEQEIAAAEDFAKKINLTDSNIILQYGASVQKNIADFSEQALNGVMAKDLGSIGNSLSDLVTELKGFKIEEEKKGFFSFFKKGANKLSKIKAQYDKVDVNVDKIVNILENHQVKLMKDVAMLDDMYNLNLKYFKELTMYIYAGKKKLEDVKNGELKELYEKAQSTKDPEDVGKYNDLSAMCERFEKKLHDLELTRTISLQMGPQTRLVQNNDVQMIEKIQSSIVNTIPLWKSQMVLALGIQNSRNATEAQRAVTDMTNDMLKQNADMLKLGSAELARESQRSIVDIETVKYTNEQLIATLDEVMEIQREGAAKRKEAEAELTKIEGELKNKLLEIKG